MRFSKSDTDKKRLQVNYGQFGQSHLSRPYLFIVLFIPDPTPDSSQAPVTLSTFKSVTGIVENRTFFVLFTILLYTYRTCIARV
jgi:hypothetical protein